MSEKQSSFTVMPILQVIIERIKLYKNLNLKNITFVCIQHLLFTTVDLIKSLIILGATPKYIHVMGKIYSTCPEVVERIIKMGVVFYPSSQPNKLGYFNNDIINMWDSVRFSIINTKSNTIIILDDGSKAIINIPQYLINNYIVFAVEQTSYGISQIKSNDVKLPVINVAYSAAKQLLESPMIAQAVITKLEEFLSFYINRDDSLTYGVVGLGVIGRAVVQKLLSLNNRVIVYDIVKEKYNLVNNVIIRDDIQLLMQEADCIFGCTGADITVSLDIEKIQGTKTLISCSSQDIEFQSLLRIIQNNSSCNPSNVLNNINYPINNGMIKIFRGGYPVNLDNTGESVPAKYIQLTRGLLLGGIIQAILQLVQGQEYKQYMLDPKIQKLIAQKLKNILGSQDYNNLLVTKFIDEGWIKNNSRGEYVNNNI